MTVYAEEVVSTRRRRGCPSVVLQTEPTMGCKSLGISTDGHPSRDFHHFIHPHDLNKSYHDKKNVLFSYSSSVSTDSRERVLVRDSKWNSFSVTGTVFGRAKSRSRDCCPHVVTTPSTPGRERSWSDRQRT